MSRRKPDSEAEQPELSQEELALRNAAAKLVNDDSDLGTRWYVMADWPTSMATDAIAAAWDMESSDPQVEIDLQDLLARGLIEKVGDNRYRLNDLMQRVAAGLFGQQ